MTYTLSMTFNTSSGTKSTMSINQVKPTLTDEEVNSLMDSIISDGIFQIPGKGSFVSKASAEIIKKETTDYDVE